MPAVLEPTRPAPLPVKRSDEPRLSKEEMTSEILRMKVEKNVCMLAHNYQRPEIQDLADHVGDSFALAQAAAKVEQKIIQFCGVHFMAESAKILNPDKTVLLPDLRAGCPLADAATAEKVAEAKRQYPDAMVISYINSSADVKAMSDICCTSSNAMKIIQHYRDRPIIYLPDKNLAEYAKIQLGKEDIITWDGWCYVHDIRITEEKLLDLMEQYPDALVVAHPECHYDILKHAHHVTSTSGMVKYVRETDHSQFIVLTEIGMGHTLRRIDPNKEIIMIPDGICYNMKVTTLRAVYESLRDLKHEIEVPEPVRSRAKLALDRMLEFV